MDPQTFGAFVAENRKALGLTQADLAQRLQVTAKAVSGGSGGKGFPDIGTIQPLAKALELSVLELMESRRRADGPAFEEEVTNVMKATVEIQRETRRAGADRPGTGAVCLSFGGGAGRRGGYGKPGRRAFSGGRGRRAGVCLYYCLENWETRKAGGSMHPRCDWGRGLCPAAPFMTRKARERRALSRAFVAKL